jgi:hypothetical protein
MAEVKTAVERRKASALRSARAASADAAPVLRFPALRLPSFFGGETAVAFVLAAKLGRDARRENEIARLSPRRSRFLLPACGEKVRMRGRCRDSELIGDVLAIQ